MKLDSKAFGLTAGIFGGSWWLLAMVYSLTTGVGRSMLMKIGEVHPGFSYSYSGAVWMGVLHLICGFIFGWLFATLYNKLSK